MPLGSRQTRRTDVYRALPAASPTSGSPAGSERVSCRTEGELPQATKQHEAMVARKKWVLVKDVAQGAVRASPSAAAVPPPPPRLLPRCAIVVARPDPLLPPARPVL
jgi:hypothetical protein